jgi:hypothetical protein
MDPAEDDAGGGDPCGPPPPAATFASFQEADEARGVFSGCKNSYFWLGPCMS